MRAIRILALVVAACPMFAAERALPRGFLKQCAVFRGPSGSGFHHAENVPSSWDERTKRDILWRTPIDLPAFASPVVWAGRVVALGSDGTKSAVICFDIEDGRRLWRTEIPLSDKATRGYTPDAKDERWNRMLHAGATPATNGTEVVASFSTGQLVGLDLAGGSKRWEIGLGDTSENSFGLDNSILIYKNTAIVVFEGADRYIAAFDASTGERRWITERENPTWASPILIRTLARKYQVVLPSDPDVTAWDPDTGEKIWSVKVLTGGPEYCVGPSPVYGGGLVFVNCQNSGIFAIDPVRGKRVWRHTELEAYADGVSMVTDGRILYQYYRTRLTAFDCMTGKMLKSKTLKEEASYASPALCAGRLYLMGQGATLVCEADPARDFPLLGVGRISDACDASPAIVDGKILLRTDKFLYCIGDK